MPVLDLEPIRRAFTAASGAYATADPFPHAIFDGLIDPDLLCQVAAEFPDPATMGERFAADHERHKYATADWADFGPATSQVIADLNSGPALASLEILTGIPHLVADGKLEGGGQHQITTGGHLSVHADFNRHSDTGLERRLNALLYLNDPWEDAWGGHLELWDRRMRACSVKVAPTLGRLVVFSTTATSFHGHPEPLTCPPGVTRKSLALYYYTNTHRDDDLDGMRTTQFQARPGTRDAAPKRTTKERVARWLPPVVTDALSRR